MDPHGADGRGNPLGGLLFSNNFTGGGTNYEQVVEWHNFMGSGVFCLKACDPAGANAANFCQHVFDRIGCQYNAPAAYVDNLFLSCDGDDQDFPGVYTGTNGVVTTYVQPPESLGPISTMPYVARIPASSNCVTYQSAAIFSGQPNPTLPLTGTNSLAVTVAGATGTAAATGAGGMITAKPAASTAHSAAATTTASKNGGIAVTGSLFSVAFGGLIAVVALL